jgi:glucosyl-dolichyl phosphate glucuronosyltransferase
MTEDIDVTVILCTYNRCESLKSALESLTLSSFPETISWEVLVVDNNSKDHTREAVQAFSRRYPGRFRYVFEPQQGKSFALNSGIREARGAVLAFVDDDVVVGQDWLYSLTSPLYGGKWAGSGGRILPERGFVPPRWLAVDGPFSQIGALCAYSDLGDDPGELKAPLVGANMAIRREMFEKYGNFRTDLGPRPGSELRHEDRELGHRLVNGGERLRYVPSAIVYHQIHQSRVRKEFFLAWWFDFGRGFIRETERSLSAKATLKTAARASLTALQWLIAFDPQRRFYRKCRTRFEIGKVVESFHQLRQEKSSASKIEQQVERA